MNFSRRDLSASLLTEVPICRLCIALSWSVANPTRVINHLSESLGVCLPGKPLKHKNKFTLSQKVLLLEFHLMTGHDSEVRVHMVGKRFREQTMRRDFAKNEKRTGRQEYNPNSKKGQCRGTVGMKNQFHKKRPQKTNSTRNVPPIF